MLPSAAVSTPNLSESYVALSVVNAAMFTAVLVVTKLVAPLA
jgi:hypothetical protein